MCPEGNRQGGAGTGESPGLVRLRLPGGRSGDRGGAEGYEWRVGGGLARPGRRDRMLQVAAGLRPGDDRTAIDRRAGRSAQASAALIRIAHDSERLCCDREAVIDDHLRLRGIMIFEPVGGKAVKHTDSHARDRSSPGRRVVAE